MTSRSLPGFPLWSISRAASRTAASPLVLHVVVWTAPPALLSYNLQLDLAQDLALGRERQLDCWKHPPLPWWAADLAYRIAFDYPRRAVQEPLVLPRQAYVARERLRPVRVYFAIVPPRR